MITLLRRLDDIPDLVYANFMNFDPSKIADEWTKPPLWDCYFLTGPTCSGKTSLAIELAKQLDAEILSLDSMAIYRGMDIGTAKPSREQQAAVPHHLIDIADPTEAYSVSCYVEAAHAKAAEIRARGNEFWLQAERRFISSAFCAVCSLGLPPTGSFGTQLLLI